MPKPVRTHPRGAACITMICSLGLLVACCGCPGMLWKPEPPKAVSIVIQADGSITVDGEPAGPREQWAELLKKKAAARQAALQAAPAPAVPQPPDQRPRGVLINVVAPDKTSYETFSRVLLACGSAELLDLDLQGVPFSLPRVSGCVAGRKDDTSPGPPTFLPLEVRSAEDLVKVQENRDNLADCGIWLRGTSDCPMSLVIAAVQAIHEAGAPFGFLVPLEATANTKGPPLVLNYAELQSPGVIRSEMRYIGDTTKL
jgi:hypothetical protein